MIDSDRRPAAPRTGDLLLKRATARPQRPPAWSVRAFDLAVAGTALILATPLILMAILAIVVADGRPVFFAQERIGRHGRPFRVVKLRTMATDADDRLKQLLQSDLTARREFQTARKLQNDPRLIGPGRLIRGLKIDELPQLWNVLRGDMAIIGPRPVVPAEIARYGPYGQVAFSVRPGLSGPWQVRQVP